MLVLYVLRGVRWGGRLPEVLLYYVTSVNGAQAPRCFQYFAEAASINVC